MADELENTGVTVNALTPGGMANTGLHAGSPFDPAKLLQPEIMVPPVLWLVSDAASKVTARRFIAARWDPALPPEEAAAVAGGPVGWPTAGSRAINPEGMV